MITEGFKSIGTWQIVYYIVSFIFGGCLMYFVFRDKERSRIFYISFCLLGSSAMGVVVLASPQLPSLLHTGLYGVVWSTSALIGNIAYHIHKKLLKRKDDG